MRKILFFLVLILLFSTAVLVSKNTGITNTDTTIVTATSPSPSPVPEPTTFTSDGLKNEVENTLNGEDENYAIVIKNLKTGESYSLNDHQSFESGSLYKLWVMGEVEREIKNGTSSDDQTLSKDATILNDEFGITPDEAGAASGNVTYTVDAALNSMITISDNYAALLLTDKITLNNLSQFLTDNGFNESQLGSNNTPTTTASDISLFYEKLYQGKLVDSEYSQKMLNLLKDQEINDRIPKYLPDGIVVAHKTGDIDDYSNDAGIVYSPNADYIIVVLSQTDSSEDPYEMIAQLSKVVYNYFNQ